jgi:drug/metabolite transporter (DMT)-like permease
VLLAGFFAALGLFGTIGMGVIALVQPAIPEGPAGFVFQAFAVPGAQAAFWVFMQALLSVIGVGMMVKAYQIADATRVAVFEYVILPASAFWGWVIWGETLGVLAMAGMVLIAVAGTVIAVRGK